MKLSEQEKQPHKSLVQVRNSIEAAIGCGRKKASGIANCLSCDQCDSIVKADGDSDKIKSAIESVKPVEKPVEETKPKRQTKRK